MMSCDSFRTRFTPETNDAALLAHLRSCDACLNFAVERDGDVLFRSLGGEMVPPGGVDAFVGDVMREVRLRGTETTVGRTAAWPRKLAAAAALTATIAGSGYMYEHNRAPITVARVTHHDFAVNAVAAKPVIENYDSEKATIVEIPTEGEDVKVVMVFDESLPADL